ncbi:hypothetical protein CRG98_048666, partial [Punica granatum]
MEDNSLTMTRALLENLMVLLRASLILGAAGLVTFSNSSRQ